MYRFVTLLLDLLSDPGSFFCRHDETVAEFRNGNLYLRCTECRRRSPGWDLNGNH